MLILNRKTGVRQGIKIGDDIQILIGKLNGKYVQIMIDAPRKTTIYRTREVMDGDAPTGIHIQEESTQKAE